MGNMFKEIRDIYIIQVKRKKEKKRMVIGLMIK